MKVAPLDRIRNLCDARKAWDECPERLSMEAMFKERCRLNLGMSDAYTFVGSTVEAANKAKAEISERFNTPIDKIN
jgi:hypothetical protein